MYLRSLDTHDSRKSHPRFLKQTQTYEVKILHATLSLLTFLLVCLVAMILFLPLGYTRLNLNINKLQVDATYAPSWSSRFVEYSNAESFMYNGDKGTTNPYFGEINGNIFHRKWSSSRRRKLCCEMFHTIGGYVWQSRTEEEQGQVVAGYSKFKQPNIL